MALDPNYRQMHAAIDQEMQKVVDNPLVRGYPGLGQILRYHLGWESQGTNAVDAQGKRIRPILVLLSAAAAGGIWEAALPAAASVEILHNFSLIHDDIEDNSPMRRGRETVWKKWGQALAINAGDALFTLAYESLTGLSDTATPAVVAQAFRIMNETCIRLTGGQHLDISYEQERSIPLDWYWLMIGGKTGALLSGCTRLGGLVGGANQDQIQALGEFGLNLGLSFQVQDDWLGLWGDAQQTGKSTQSDLVSGKKTLPVVYALDKGGQFAERWQKGRIEPDEVPELSQLLIEEGAQDYTQKKADELTKAALAALERTGFANDASQALRDLAQALMNRRQ